MKFSISKIFGFSDTGNFLNGTIWKIDKFLGFFQFFSILNSKLSFVWNFNPQPFLYSITNYSPPLPHQFIFLLILLIVKKIILKVFFHSKLTSKIFNLRQYLIPHVSSHISSRWIILKPYVQCSKSLSGSNTF